MGYPMASGYRNRGGEAPADAPQPSMGFQDGWQGFMDVPWSPPLPGQSVPQIPAPVSLGLSLLIRRNPWVRAALLARDLMRIYSTSPPPYDGGSPPACANGTGVGKYHGGGGCVSVNHFVSGHQPPRTFFADEGQVLFEDTHDCVRNGTLFGQDLNAKTVSYPYGSGWVRTSGLPKPRWYPYGFTYPLNTPSDPQWDPATDPFYKPLHQPQPDFDPLPYRALPYRGLPWSDPSPLENPNVTPRTPAFPQPGLPPQADPRTNPGPTTDPVFPGVHPDPKTDPKTDPKVDPKPDPNPDPRTDPKTDPKPDPKPQPYADAALEWRPPTSHRLKPPYKGVREVKIKLHMIAKFAYRFAGSVTEVRDAIKSVHDALPKKMRTKRKCHGHGKFRSCNAPTVQKMAKEIYQGIGKMTDKQKVDFGNKALDNLITDQIKDYVFGKIGQQIGYASKAAGRPIGFQAGPSL